MVEANKPFSGLGRTAAAQQSGAQKKEAKLRKAKARAEEQRRKLLKQGIDVTSATGENSDTYDLNALTKGPNRFTFLSSDYWQVQQKKIEEKIEKRYFNAPVSDEVMEMLIKETAEELAEELIQRDREDSIPSVGELWTTICRERKANEPMFVSNDWIEYLDDDMIWKLGKVLRSFRIVDDKGEEGKQIHYMEPEEEEEEKGGDSGGDEEENVYYMYKVEGCGKNLNDNEVRVSEEGLVRLFGRGPWIWQQYALVLLERKLRFQEHHHNDFEIFDYMQFAKTSFKTWLYDPRNIEFRRNYKDERIGEFGRTLLKDHIFKPFKIMSLIANHEEGWEPAESEEFSIFSYSSIFGSGLTLPLIVMGIQIMLPSLLVYSNFASVDEFTLDSVFCVQDDEATDDALKLTTIMVIMIQLLYSTQVVVDRLIAFAASLGIDLGFGTYDVFYRFKALRSIIREERYESAVQSVGYTMDILMNTLYVCLLYIVNVLNIIQAADPFEVLLNALALEFVGTIDEQFAQSTWWDPDRRWIRAGGVSITIQASIAKKVLKNAAAFSAKYNLKYSKLVEAVGAETANSVGFIKNIELARKDDNNLKYLSPDDRVEHDLSFLSKRINHVEAIEYNTKGEVYFGFPDRYLLGSAVKPLFFRYVGYRTWSIWDKILFLADVPDIRKEGKKAVFANAHSSDFSKYWMEYEAGNDVEFMNWYGKSKNVFLKAVKTIFRTIFFFEICEKVKESLLEGNVKDVFFWMYDALFEWFSYSIQLFFPIYIISGFFYSIHCYEKIADNDETSGSAIEG